MSGLVFEALRVPGNIRPGRMQKGMKRHDLPPPTETLTGPHCLCTDAFASATKEHETASGTGTVELQHSSPSLHPATEVIHPAAGSICCPRGTRDGQSVRPPRA